MKKTIIALCVVFILMISVGFVIAGKQTKTEYGDNYRYLVKSNNGMLKMMYGVQHNFNNGFTADLTQGQLKALEKLGVEVEEVGISYITGKPSCGDNICQGNEAKTCPTDCSTQPPVDPYCGDGICNGDETSTSCPQDCPAPVGRDCYPSTQTPYGITMVNGGTGGAGINVAVLDTGVYTNHLDLDVKLCKDATKKGIQNGCADGNGHGTHVSGTIAANGGSDGAGILGVAPKANLWMVKVCGSGGSCWNDDIAAGIRYVTDNGANIISMSLGGDTESSLIKNAIDYATSKGVLVIAAAGNDGPADGSIDYPGANVKVVAVGAINSNEAVASWSSRGINPGTQEYVIEEREVEFGAPGVNIESTWKDGCYNIISGTSMATPHVAGLAAKLWKDNAVDTRTYLQELARTHDLYTERDDSATGFGLPVAP